MYMCYAWDPWMFMIIYVWLCVKLTPSGLWWTAYLFVWMGRRRTRVVVNCLSGFGDFIYGCMLILWHVYFSDVWFISVAAVENFRNAYCMIFVEDVASISWINVLFACFITLIEVGRYSRDCKLVLSRRFIGLNQGLKVNWIISFHLQRTWGSF